ncbi:MAG TPA: TIR domain-containing protein [Planctomycetaceae bacterium]|jgi:predicted nucleotide-binding protein|nr:TIR domain-containing protein [Planctomycetaceae bacterium]
MAGKRQSVPSVSKSVKRVYVSQSDVPSLSLDQALRVPRALAENYNGRPTTPLNVASALDMSPTSGTFRALCGSAIAYGLTSGGYNAQQISMEETAKRIIQPTDESQELGARRQAVLKPRVIGEFLLKYDAGSLPRPEIAYNVLVEMGVPRDRAESIYRLIVESAQSVGFVRDIKGKQYIALDGASKSIGDISDSAAEGVQESTTCATPLGAGAGALEPDKNAQATVRTSDSRRVFLTHGNNKSFIEPIKRLLAFGELTPVVSVERQSVSKPVPDKVMDDMRGCGAAIIHVDEEQTLVDRSANEHIILNQNVLIEIGAAMALFGRRFILLVKDGLQLPSNLQGLYEVRYTGEILDGDATIRLLGAINDLKNNPLPIRTS